jgi:hypothetical protein
MLLRMINEGFRFVPSIGSAEYSQHVPNKSNGSAFDFLRSSGKFVYSETDSPEDFIFVEPVMKSKTLAIKDVDPRSLSTFEGAQILYGFTVRDDEQYRDKITKSTRNETGLRSKFRQLLDFGWPSSEINMRLSSPESFKRFVSLWTIELTRLKRNRDNDVDEEEFRSAIDAANEIAELMRTHQVEEFEDLLDKFGESELLDKSFNRTYVGKLQYAFAKAVKKPNTSEELEIQHKFMELAAEILVERTSADYDLIMYPKSSKKFNQNFSQLVSEYTGSEVMEIPKVKVKDVILNYEEMRRRAVMTKVRRDPETGKPMTPTKWAEKEIRKLKIALGDDPEKEAEIKAVAYGDKRRYAQLFKISDPEALRDKSILIVDDNVAHQGTMEMVHALVKMSEPKSVVLYTPLLLKNMY